MILFTKIKVALGGVVNKSFRFFRGGCKPLIIRTLSNFSRTIRGEISTEVLVRKGLIIGKNFSREGGCRIDASAPFLIEIGDNVALSTDVTILAHDASLKRHIGILKLGKVIIGNNVFVGAKSLILPNVTIGSNVIIGAGSVITHDIPNNVVVAGNPARVIRTTDEYIDKFKKKIYSGNLLNRSYSPLQLDDKKKEIIKCLCENGYCYMMSDNYQSINANDEKK